MSLVDKDRQRPVIPGCSIHAGSENIWVAIRSFSIRLFGVRCQTFRFRKEMTHLEKSKISKVLPHPGV